MSECCCGSSSPTPEVEEILRVTDRVVSEVGTGEEKCIAVLQAIQNEFRYLPAEALNRVVETTDITASQVAGVSTFYSQFRHSGTGEHLIQVCHGTACHVAGAERITDTVRRHLGLEDGEDTTEDGKFTVEKVGCVGCCSLAPVMLIDGYTYGHLNAQQTPEAIEQFLRDEAAGLHDKEAEEREEVRRSGIESGMPPTEIRVGLNSCCMASGSLDVANSLKESVKRANGNAIIKPVGCTGMCHRVPLVEVVEADGDSTLYGDSTAQTARRMVRDRVKARGFLNKIKRMSETAIDYILDDDAWQTSEAQKIDPDRGPGAEFLKPQVRIVTRDCEKLNPVDIDDYIDSGGYEGLRKAVTLMSADDIIDAVEGSGLRGRGGAGFPTGRKWRITRGVEGDRKFVVCNGDEGDPGAFMDRMLLEAYPHRVIEGLAIAARAVGAHEGYLYVRAEYGLAVQRVEQALELARERGFLGKGIFDSDFDLDLKMMRGAGAFVCGEETALLASIMGLRGMPRFRPPFPAEKGLWECPTNVNNVETYACVPYIISNGPEAFNTIGTEGSKGTKVFALAGRVERGGLIEVPMGTTIAEIVNEIGGGVKEAKKGRKWKAVQLGGPSGGCLPTNLAHTPIDYEEVNQTGAIMGSGGLVVLDDTTCMVDVAKFFLQFTQEESCGKCTFCRVGTKRMLEILERLCEGKGSYEDLDNLEQLAHQIKSTSLCGLGKTAPNPILTTLRYFHDEYVAHIEGRCPAGKCPELIRYEINDRCIGCTLCAQQCPTDAIPAEPYEKHTVESSKCVRCGGCLAVCPEDAVEIVPRWVNAKEKKEDKAEKASV